MKPKIIYEQLPNVVLRKLVALTVNPYTDIRGFIREVSTIMQGLRKSAPKYCKVFENIVAERAQGHKVHILRNCPMD